MAVYRRRFPAARRWLRELIHGCLDEVFPMVCVGCGRVGPVLCAGCRPRLQRCVPPLCDRCGAPLGLAGAACAAPHRDLRGLDRARAAFRYAGLGGELVRRLKFDRDVVTARFLAAELAAVLAAWRCGPGRRAVVVAVPMHPRKRRRRGFDHAALFAEILARTLELPWRSGLVRVRETLPQGDVRVTSRERNVRGAFAARRPAAVARRPVLLVDDVRTSGCTARECARVLRAAGATGVVLATATVAR